MIIDIQAFDSLGKTTIIFIMLIDSKAYTKALLALNRPSTIFQMFLDDIHYIEARPKK